MELTTSVMKVNVGPMMCTASNGSIQEGEKSFFVKNISTTIVLS